MYPEDQDREQQPANHNLMGEAPQPFNYGQPMQQNLGRPQQPPHLDDGADRSGIFRVLPWIFSGILLLLVMVFGVLFLMKAGNNDNKNGSNGNTNQSSDPSSVANECSSKLRRYQNVDLDIRFCYPTEWGDVKVADGKLDPSDGGTRVRLSFVDKPQVRLGLVSDDWSTDSGKVPGCTDPSAQAFPDTTAFSAKWVTQTATDGQIVSALRGLEVVPDQYLLQELTDNTTVQGACLEGYQAFGGAVYRNAAVTMHVPFTSKITSPKAHLDNPTALIPVSDRNEVTAFVKSIAKF